MKFTTLISYLPLFVAFQATPNRQTHFTLDIDANGLSLSSEINYDNDKLVKIQVDNNETLEKLSKFIEEHLIDNWTPLRIGSIDLRMDDNILSKFYDTFNLTSEIKIPNIQCLINEQANLLTQKTDFKNFFKNYHSLQDIYQYFELKLKQNPIGKIITLGKSYEGRQIKAIKITGNSTNTNKPQIVFHGGTHAREWISGATVSYIAKHLLADYKKNSQVKQLIDTFDFIIAPVLNVDGYEYSRTKDRLWRKNRQPTSIPWCKGIDINRNWGFHWAEAGSSYNPCSEAYHGPSAFASPEIKAVADYLSSNNVISYFDIHAYSQLWMYPFGYTCKESTDNESVLSDISSKAVKSLSSVYGTKFAFGSICKTIYPASGSSVDWAYAEAGVKYPFAIELRDTGKYGFMLPPSYIKPSGQETYQALLSTFQSVKDLEKL